jgi:hypothetical protein
MHAIHTPKPYIPSILVFSSSLGVGQRADSMKFTNHKYAESTITNIVIVLTIEAVTSRIWKRFFPKII